MVGRIKLRFEICWPLQYSPHQNEVNQYGEGLRVIKPGSVGQRKFSEVISEGGLRLSPFPPPRKFVGCFWVLWEREREEDLAYAGWKEYLVEVVEVVEIAIEIAAGLATCSLSH